MKLKNALKNPAHRIVNSSVVKYFREAYSELRKVTWPSQKDTIMYSSIVLILSLSTAIVIGGLDLGLTKGLEFLISKIPA